MKPQRSPYHDAQICCWLAASLAVLRTYEVLKSAAKATPGNALRRMEKTCAAIPWLPREQAKLKDGSSVWIGPVSTGRELAGYYATLPQETLEERFHHYCVTPGIKKLVDNLDAGLIRVIGAYDNGNKLVGVAEAVLLRDPTKVEANFSIHPEYQGKRLSGYLVNACLRQCAERGYETVIAEVETSKKSVRLIKLFPKADRTIDGRDITLFLHFGKHPEIRQGLLEQAHIQSQRRLIDMLPVSPAVRGLILFPSRLVASLACS